MGFTAVQLKVLRRVIQSILGGACSLLRHPIPVAYLRRHISDMRQWIMVTRPCIWSSVNFENFERIKDGTRQDMISTMETKIHWYPRCDQWTAEHKLKAFESGRYVKARHDLCDLLVSKVPFCSEVIERCPMAVPRWSVFCANRCTSS